MNSIMRSTIMVLLLVGFTGAQFDGLNPKAMMQMMKKMMAAGAPMPMPPMPQMVLVGMVEQPIPTPVAVPYSIPPPVVVPAPTYAAPASYAAPTSYSAPQAAIPYAAQADGVPYEALAGL